MKKIFFKKTHCGNAHLPKGPAAMYIKAKVGGANLNQRRNKNPEAFNQNGLSTLLCLCQDRAARNPERNRKISTPRAELPLKNIKNICINRE